MQSKPIILASFITIALICGLILLLLIIHQRSPMPEKATASTIADAPEVEGSSDGADNSTERTAHALAKRRRSLPTINYRSTPTSTAIFENDFPQETALPPREAKLFVIIDDVGYSIDDLSQFLELDIPLTFAILPNLEHSLAAVELISKHGHQYILHLPMEPFDTALTDPQAILVSDSDQVIRNKIIAMTASLPNIKGVNNHMGSRASSDERIMRILFEQLKVQDLFFVNSLTSVHTIRHKMADEIGLAYLERHLFLDHVVHPQAIALALAKGTAQALTSGEAVLIGHVGVEATARILAKYADSSEAQQVTFDYIGNHDNFRN